MHQLSFNKFDFVASKPLELVHSDVWGPASVISINDFRYYLVLIDEYSKFIWVYLLKNKSNVFDIFKYFKAYVENQLNTSLKVLRTNGGDVQGPAPVISINDFRYYLVLIDEYSKFTWVYLLKNKSNVFDIFKYFKAYVENQLNVSLKVLRTNGGGEFTSNAFNLFCSSHGIIHQTTCPHTPQ